MGLRLVDRTKVAVDRIYCADRERDPETMAIIVGTTNSMVIITETRFDPARALDATVR
jgi:hypothetical protein